MTTVAVMQPYFFPYLGYWQLIEAADRFVVLDDVNYINRGWVNRNRILVNSTPSYITVPLSQASQNKYICDLRLQASPVWRSKMLKSIELAYRRSACFDEVFPVVEQLVNHEVENLSDYLTYQLQSLAAFMGINTEFVSSSRCYANRHLSGQQRIIDICRIEGGHTYINLPGGRELYDAAAFDASGLALNFISMLPCSYRQKSTSFVPNLSIIDLLMACGAENVKTYLRSYELLSPLVSSLMNRHEISNLPIRGIDMTSSEQNGEYWVDYWTNNPIFERENPQSQVARTINKVPIDDETWQAHLDAIERILALSSTDDLLDLCAGNGLIAKPFSLKCRSVMAVDISRALLEKIDSEAYPSVRVLVGDAREVELPEEGFSKGIMYGALQYFVDKEVIDIFAKIYRALRPGGVFLVGDIPDIDRLFDFYNKPEWVAAYFDSIREGRPAIGTWFKKEILTHMARYVGFDQAIALSQPPGFINGHYRFDLLLTK